VTVANFTVEEARRFVESFFPVVARESARGSEKSIDERWIAIRLAELLSGSFDELLQRPVHAQMLCQIATDPDESLSHLSKYRLFDRFVHFLIDREVRKRGRDPVFSLEVRRNFNRALAYWLWGEGAFRPLPSRPYRSKSVAAQQPISGTTMTTWDCGRN
jgi:hypothetical protein